MNHENPQNNVKLPGWNILKSHKQEVGKLYLSWEQQNLKVQNCKQVLKTRW